MSPANDEIKLRRSVLNPFQCCARMLKIILPRAFGSSVGNKYEGREYMVITAGGTDWILDKSFRAGGGGVYKIRKAMRYICRGMWNSMIHIFCKTVLSAER